MKCVLTLLSALLLTQSIYAFQGEINITSTIQRVKVFRESAQVTRTAKITIPAGQTVLRFANLAADLVETTIQLKSDGNFTVLSVDFAKNYLNETAEAETYRKLENSRDSLQELLDREQVALQVLTEGENFLLANKEVGGNAGIAVDKLNAALDYQQNRLSEIKLKKLGINAVIKKLQAELQKNQNQLKNFTNQGKRATGEVMVKVLAKVNTQANFELSYVVFESGWTPHYDVRVKDVNSPMGFTYKADVYQNSGEDWKQVQLTLTDGEPLWMRSKPELVTQRLKLFEPGSMISYDTVNAFDPETYEERFKIVKNEIDIPEANLVENPLSFEFQIATPYDIPNGESYTVFIKEYNIPAFYEYVTVPKMNLSAFLMARFTNWEQYNLLSGAVNLYFEDAFMGKSTLNVESIKDTLSLSIGKDENVVVTRTVERQFTDNQFIGNKKTETYGWNIELRNKKKQKINIVVEDQYPLSTNDDIEVTLDNAKGAEVDKESGLLKWKLALDAGKSEKLNFRYSVKYPKKQKLVLE